MKNLFKSLMLVAVAAMAFTACQKDNGEVNAVAKKTVINFTGGFDADTRSYFGDKVGESYPSFWEGGEQVMFVAPAADYDGTYTAYAEAVKLDEEGKSATFTVEFPSYAPIKAGTVYAYVGQGWNTFDNYAYVNNYQTPSANSVDPNCHMTYASFEYDGESLDFAGTFEHGVAYGKMTVNGFEGKKISEVTIELFENVDMYPTTYRLNTAELDTHTYWFAAEACKVQKFTVSVVADEVTYSKSVELTAEQSLEFNVGRVSTFSVSNLAIPLDTPIINASFADGKVTATWGAIANAAAYKVEVNGEVVEEAYKETSYTFDAEYNTQYEIAVTALAGDNSVLYSDSDKGSTSLTTPLDINMVTDYEVTLKSYTFVGETYSGLTYKFTGEAANDWIEIPFNTNIEGDLPAGTYTGVGGSYAYSSTSALEYARYDVSCNLAEKPAESLYWNQSPDLVVVERENNSFKVTAIVTISIDGSKKTVKYVYEETNEEPAEPAGIVFTSSLLEASSGFGDFYINFSDGAGLKLRLNFYNCQKADKNFLPVGTYNVQTGGGGIYYDASATYTYAEKDGAKYAIFEGAVVVSEVNGVYKFEFDLVVNGLGEIKGTYEGEIEGLVVPSEYVEPEPELPTDVTELTIAMYHCSYNQGDEHEMHFYLEDMATVVSIDFAMNRVTSGTYTLEDGLNAYYCQYEWDQMKSCTAIVTDNGGGNLTIEATFQAADGKWYHFIYTDQIYEN